MTRRSRVSLLALTILAMVALVAFNGCNDEPDFNVDELFTLQDYARDTDYATALIDMMNNWQVHSDEMLSYLGGRVDAPNFGENPPVGWVQSEVQGFEDYYERRFPDGSVDIVGFNIGLTDPPEDISPVKVDYVSVKSVDFVGGVSANLGDSLSYWYADDYENLAEVEGTGSFIDLRVVFFGSGSAFGGAGMLNQWNVEMSNVLADPNAMQGNYELTGTTTIVDAQTQEELPLAVEAEISIRPNGTGEAAIYVEQEERARIVFTRYDTAFHGYVLQAEDEFNERLRF